MIKMTLIDDIHLLKKQKKAIILAHNYQRAEVQDIADYVGDSIQLSRKAVEEKDAEIIVFSAVDFMAESAAILNPRKKVLLPSVGARCPMAQMLPAEEVRLWKRRYPKTPIVLYVNTLAEAKAEAETKAAAEAQEKAKAEAEAKAKAEAEAKATAGAKVKEKDDLQALRQKRAQEREKLERERKAREGKELPKTAAAEQLSLVDRLIQNLDRIHRRV